ncbi:tetratricopeptide repeat protein 39C [Octopus sinensis]|uniref:Tetratricopeptide repeat protein 39C n=1 Tax=Octopus sinensis TaxID=2607531 RepID=A0A6P7TNJ2_9MOLL|nr:tetratricopeptide repeat protein 39C [Octopus sinensis]
MDSSGENSICYQSLADESEIAQTGIHMLLNNGFREAKLLFDSHKNESPLMHAGSTFVLFMQALMSFEEERIEEATKALQETEKKCDPESGVFKTLRRKFSKKKRHQEVQIGSEDRMQRQIIIADSLLYQAVLTFTHQDIPSYIKGGWLLRKAWKIYERLHRDITEMLSRHSQTKLSQSTDSISSNNSDVRLTSDSTCTDGNDNELTQDVLERLLGAVNFGYGTFQLCVSMVPPKILKLIEFLGFEGDRTAGLAALNETSNSKDMKAPLAILGLLWYHTVLRPFFALDGIKISAGICDAELLIKNREKEFPRSSLFLFFKGRVHTLKRENELALSLYRQALTVAAGQREIELMCLYEIGWCNLMKLRWTECLYAFQRLRDESKWSKCYYSYLLAVCHGSLGDVEDAQNIFQDVPSLVRSKNNQIESFASHRAEKMKSNQVTQEFCKLFTLELVFLWHALPTCTDDELRRMLTVCESQTDARIFHLKCLLEGTIHKELGDTELAIQYLEEALARCSGKKDDVHVAAFSLYELASIYITDEPAKSIQLLQCIKEKYKDYHFENRLTVRANNMLRNLKPAG